MDWELFFHIFLREKEIFFEFVGTLDEQLFKNALLQNLFILVRKFAQKHKKQPTFDTLTMLLDKLPDVEKDNLSAYTKLINKISNIKGNIDNDVLREEVYKEMQKFEIEKVILKTANKIGTVTVDDIVGDLRDITKKFAPKSIGVDITNVEKVMHSIRHDVTEKVTSGIESLDKLLYGGFGTGEIAIVMAPPGKGKSFFLLNGMYGALLAQKNVLYLTYELYEKSVLRRLYSRISYASRKDMLDEETISKLATKFFTLAKSNGRIVYAPSKSMSVEGVESLLEQQNLYYDFHPDIIVVDYIDLLAPRHSDIRLEMRHRLRGITEDLRSLGVRKGIPVLSATQANRASLAKMHITEANVSEAFGKIEVADIVLAICQTDEEKRMKRARVVVLKNRDYVSGGCIEVYVDFDRMLLLDLNLADKLGLLVKPEKEKA